MGQHVRLSVDNHVGWLEFNRSPVNAFHHAMVQEVLDALRRYEADRAVRVVVFASALEGYFSAGADLDIFVGIDQDRMAALCDQLHEVVHAIRHSRKPQLAAIHGKAVGGGLEMTLHCDVRFAADNASLGQPEVNINFIPPLGTTQSLIRLIGRPRALKYLYDGELVSAQEAAKLGLVDELVPAGALRRTVQGYAERLCKKPPEALASIRRSIIEGGGRNFDEGLQIERAEVVKLAASHNFEEGVNAFLAKRPPQWRR
jgi:enoyl-CoA hydratase/carnithine racemase